jgi:hypothetical protein
VTGSLAAGLGLALLSAAALNWGFFAQHGAVASMPPLRVRHPLRSMALLLRDLRWLAASASGLAGWALYIAALSLVQAVSAGGIGLLALLAGRGGAGLHPREWLGVGLAVGGLVLLAASLGGHVTGSSSASWKAVTAWVLLSILVAGIAVLLDRRAVAAGAGFGAAAGLLYAAGDVATKAAILGPLAFVFVALLLLSHGLGFTSLQLGYQRGGVLATAGVSTLLTNALPIAAGTFVFGEHVPGGWAGAARVLAFAFVVLGACLLASARTESGGSLSTQTSTATPLRSRPSSQKSSASSLT